MQVQRNRIGQTHARTHTQFFITYTSPCPQKWVNCKRCQQNSIKFGK